MLVLPGENAVFVGSFHRFCGQIAGLFAARRID
jgi:hypothetical protein